jgi:hypothetical protein
MLFSKASVAAQSAWIERHVEVARAQLGEEKFADIAAPEQMMSLEQAVEYALKEIS